MARVKKTIDKPVQDTQIKDSFQNFTSSLGIGSNNQISNSQYSLNPITRVRLSLELIYRGSWIAAAAVDLPSEDMCRTGISVDGLDTDNHDQLQESISDLGIWASLTEAIKWARLYGGSCAYICIEGQDPATPLNLNTIDIGQFRGLMVLDRWQLSPSMPKLITDLGPDFGLPEYYEIVADKSLSYTWTRVHHTRMIRFIGIDLPFQQRITEMGWGESVIERIYDRLVAYDSCHTGAAQMCYKAHLRTLKIPDLRQIIAAGGDQMAGVLAQVSMMRQMQSSEGITLLDGEDEFEAQSYTFAGLHEMLLAFGEQISGALQIPMVRLFGQEPGGLSSDGNSALHTYYDNLSKQQELRLRRPLTRLLDIISRSKLGEPLPNGTRFRFNTLWQMEATEQSTVATSLTNCIIAAFNSGLIDSKTAQQELSDTAHTTGLFSTIPLFDVVATTQQTDINTESTKEE